MRRVLRRLGPIGVQVGARRLIAAQIEFGSGGPRLHGVARISRASPGADLPTLGDLERLGDTMARLGFQGHRIVLVAPAERELVSILELPARASGAPLESIAPAEFARERRIEPGTFEMGWWDLPEPARAAPGTRAMAVGIAHADVTGLLEVACAAGFDPIAVDARAPAFGRAVAMAEAKAEGINAVVDVGWGGVGVSLLLGPTVVYHRTLGGVGLAFWHAEIAKQLAVDQEAAEVLLDAVGEPAGTEGSTLDRALIVRARALIAPKLAALARDVSASLSYGAHLYPGQASGRVYAVGEGARFSAVREAIADSSGLEVRTLTPDKLVDAGTWKGRGADDAGATLAVSLGLWTEGAPCSP